MKVLLVYPEMPVSFWTFDQALMLTGKKACYPPLGLCTVAAMLSSTWEKRLIDSNITPLTESDILWADMVMISAMNVQEVSVRQILSRCRALGRTTVLGGPLVTNEPERFDEVDHLILNEAEITLQPFLKDLEAGKAKHLYQSDSFADMSETPLPLWELLNLDDYLYSIVQYSRGCPFRCDFCDVTSLFGHHPRVKSPEQIIAELNAIDSKTDFYLFADDNLIADKKHLKSELLPALIKWRKQTGTNVTFGTQLTINLVDDPELMELLKAAGFTSLFIGIETPSDESLKESRKRQNTGRDLIENIDRLHRAGFIISGGFIVGFDTDPPDIFDRQIRFIQQSGIVLAGVNLLKAPPGTELFNRMKRENRLVERFSFDELRTNFIPRMDPRVLENGFKEILQSTYSAGSTYKRIIKFLSLYTPPKSIAEIESVDIWSDIKIFLRIMFHVGIVWKERKYFWKLLLWTLWNRRKLVDMAIVNSVFMYQLSRLYGLYEKNFHHGDEHHT